MLELLADRKYGGIKPGLLMTLHTWGRRLNLHPHIHCLVTMLYLARYCRGGPLNPEQLKRWSGSRVEMSYFDHRKKRAATQWLEQRQLIKRLLEHVPAEGVHTIRHAGIYASASKDYEGIVAQFGNLEGQHVKTCVDSQHRLICCKRCGEPGLLIGQRWRQSKKGISYIKVGVQDGASGSVQQGVERGLESDRLDDTS
ncbi:hypothetical protein GCM10026986_16370 [Nitrincola alkalisediminis]